MLQSCSIDIKYAVTARCNDASVQSDFTASRQLGYTARYNVEPLYDATTWALSVIPNAFAVSNEMFILFKSDIFPPTVVSSPRIEFIIACNSALDAEVSAINAFSPSEAVCIAVAWAAVIPTTSKFSVNSVNFELVWVKFSRTSAKSRTLSLHEQRRYSSFFKLQNWSIH